MKKYTLDATDENILESIQNNTLNRSSDVKDFISMLDTIDYNAFISVDADWGEGKTFFIRQVEMTMKHYYKKVFKKEITDEEKDAFQSNKVLGNLELQHTYLPIYFDAWLYDNHANALMALLMVAIKQSGKCVDTTINSDIGDKLAAVFDSIQFWNNNNWSNLREKFKGKNVLEETFLLEELRQMVKEIFSDIIEENAEKLVIFIDELDRCKPTFAIGMLESIKHYFDDDRIMFVMSVNKAQLIHTVSKYYGYNFNSNLYLNKFFDINIQLPKADTRIYFDMLGISCDDSLWIKKFANELQSYYSLSLRDTTRYFQKIVSIHKRCGDGLGVGSSKMLILFIPIICILDIVDITKKQRFLSGNGVDILEEHIMNSDIAKRFIMRLADASGDNEQKYQAGLEELRKIYDFVFHDNTSGWYNGNLDISSDFKKVCLRLCNDI